MARSNVTMTLVIIAANFAMLSFFFYLFATKGSVPDSAPVGVPPPRCPSCPRCPEQQLVQPFQQQQQQQVQCPPQLPCPSPVPCPGQLQAAQAPPSSGARRTAVLGLAKGIAFENAYRFVRSLRTAAPSTDIVIFTDKVDAELKEMYDAFGVTLALYTEQELGRAGKFHPSSYRWILIDDYLRKLPSPYDAVMFVDTRDAIFQSDPFEAVTENAFYATLEAKPRTIRECGWNRGWVGDCFGQTVVGRVGGQVISCSGTSLAAWEPALEYTGMMKKEISTNKCERNGVDQGMHNVFVHDNRLKHKLVILTNEEGPIGTVQSMKKLKRDRFGRLLNANGDVYAVVHQYDRSKALVAQYKQEYVLLSSAEQTRRD